MGVIADSNERVSEWRDYSGKQRHVLQATAGQQPLRVNAARAGLPALQFVSSRKDGLVSLTTTGITDCSIFTVFRLDAGGNNSDLPIGIGSGDNVNKCRFIYRTNNSTKVGFANWANDFAGSATDFDIGNYHAFGAIQSGANLTILKNSSEESATFGSTPQTTDQNYWAIGGPADLSGGSYYTDCTIGEVIIYNRAVNITERQQILTYLRNKWQTPV